MTRVYFDVETSGLSRTAGAKIIEVAAVTENGSEFDSLVNPGPEVVEYLKGLDRPINAVPYEELEGARFAEEVAEDLRNWLCVVAAESFHSFNNRFDSKFLEIDPWNLDPNLWGECVMLAASAGGRWLTLEKAVAKFSLEIRGTQHRALPDARAAMEIHRKILEGAM